MNDVGPRAGEDGDVVLFDEGDMHAHDMGAEEAQAVEILDRGLAAALLRDGVALFKVLGEMQVRVHAQPVARLARLAQDLLRHRVGAVR